MLFVGFARPGEAIGDLTDCCEDGRRRVLARVPVDLAGEGQDAGVLRRQLGRQRQSTALSIPPLF
ncbi:MAG: hypothetical protein DI549_12425 [Ancylobacter novellus]|uniref:Uncharacterized protein n=1 Tax=Ancylobacter novellus TaxID=921 RepID=A0A2W5SRR4_ANCNO|nr:MAG: hypothetical protein DI549_12425 [Ancylobacter novellus]